MNNAPFFYLHLFFLTSAAVCVGCGASRPPHATSDAEARGDVLRGLELIEQGDVRGALAELSAAQAADPSYEGMLRIAMAMFLEGNFAKALEGYETYLSKQPDLPGWDRAEVVAEVDRIRKALEAQTIPLGSSLASRRLRGQLALMRGQRALDRQDYRAAYQGFDVSSQYIPDPRLHLESALAGTKIEKWTDAARHLRIFLEDGGSDIERDLAFAVRAEIDRLEDLAAGRQPVTTESLADALYAKRSLVASKPTAAPAPTPPLPVPGEFRVVSGTGSVTTTSDQTASSAEKSHAAIEKIEPSSTLRATPQLLAAPVTLDELLRYLSSPSSAVRLKAVRDLVPHDGDIVRKALEDRVLQDSNLEVRRAAVEELVRRRSSASVPVLRQAWNGASTSAERSLLQRAIDSLLGVH